MTKRQPRPHDRSIDFPGTPWFVPRFRFIISLLFVDHMPKGKMTASEGRFDSGIR